MTGWLADDFRIKKISYPYKKSERDTTIANLPITHKKDCLYFLQYNHSANKIPMAPP